VTASSFLMLLLSRGIPREKELKFTRVCDPHPRVIIPAISSVKILPGLSK
jgi:hypothetical protein